MNLQKTVEQYFIIMSKQIQANIFNSVAVLNLRKGIGIFYEHQSWENMLVSPSWIKVKFNYSYLYQVCKN